MSRSLAVCFAVLQWGAVCCSVLQSVEVYVNVMRAVGRDGHKTRLPVVTHVNSLLLALMSMHCSRLLQYCNRAMLHYRCTTHQLNRGIAVQGLLLCVAQGYRPLPLCRALCYSVLPHSVIVYCSVVQCGAVWFSVLNCGALCFCVVHCCAVWCSVLQCVAACCSLL